MGMVLSFVTMVGRYLHPPNEMRAVLHKDRVRVRIVRQDRRGRPEGRVVEIIERPCLSP